MKILLTGIKKILFWSYDRGTWQYDILCVLILAFIFFSPNALFRTSKPRSGGAFPSRIPTQLPSSAASASHQGSPGHGKQRGGSTQALAGQ
jgi:hypothetical protein